LTATNNTGGRAQIVAKYLYTLNRTDIPIGVGLWENEVVGPEYEWARLYHMASYPGRVDSNGIGGLLETLETLCSQYQHVTYLEIAAPRGLGRLLTIAPQLFETCVRVVAMSGAISSFLSFSFR
jgi:hypothetical protein